MSQAEELLANLTEGVSEHNHPVTDDDGYFVIDPDTKRITNKSGQMNYLMQFDHKSERYTIEIPRIIEGHDMTLCNRVLVHFVNVDADAQAERYDFAEINDLHVNPENEDSVICTWLIERHATQLAGSLAFLVQYSCITEEGETDYEFHSDWYSDVFVKKGRRDINPTIFEYSNLLEQWYQKLFGKLEQVDSNKEHISKLSEQIDDFTSVFPQSIVNNFCTNVVDQKGSTLYQPIYLEKGCIYKIAHVGSSDIGGATITIVDNDSTMAIVTIINTNYFYPNGGITRQNFKWNGEDGWYRLRFAISGVFTDDQKAMYATGWVVAKIDDINSTEAITEFVKYGIEIDYSKVKLAEKLVEPIIDVSCIGDSLTYGYGATHGSTDYPTILSTLCGKTVHNLGVSGEATNETLARQGGYPAKVNPFTIPNDTSRVEITFNDNINVGSSEGTPLLRKTSGDITNPVIIDGIEGTISLDGERYYFSRLVGGESHEVTRPCCVVTKQMREHKNDIQIIFVGTNGGWQITADDDATRIEKLTSQIDMMIDYNTSKKYIIIGMHYFYSWILHNGLTKESLENAMKLKYGNHYINLRKYMIEYGLADANITPTEADNDAIENGEVPPSLLHSDGIHGNAKFYEILANLVHKKGLELGYWC